MIDIPKEELAVKSKIVFPTAKFISNVGYKLLSKVHLDSPTEELLEIRKNKGAILYVGLHRSLWETSGALSAIHYQGLPIPYIGMGDNLVNGRFFKRIAGKMGAFVVKRAKTRREVIESSTKLKKFITYYLSHGLDVCIFPEGTRKSIPENGKYGQFFATSFDAIQSYEKNKEKLLEQYKELIPRDSYIIPFNIDYSRIREAHEMVDRSASKPRTLHIFDSLRMITHIGDVYASFARPIKTTDVLNKSRKELAGYCHDICLNLVKILPVNIVASAVLDSLEGEHILPEKVAPNITKLMQSLDHIKDRFRGFKFGDKPEDIIAAAGRKESHFKTILDENLPYYKLYADYIGHYTGKSSKDPR
ncbi:MAG: hypothetical protein GY765_11225 [bacterium]|nr:hypothetical protein [bacterium]